MHVDMKGARLADKKPRWMKESLEEDGTTDSTPVRCRPY